MKMMRALNIALFSLGVFFMPVSVHAAVQFIGATTGTNSATMPAGVQVGDILIGVGYRGQNATPVGVPSGWTAIDPSSGSNNNSSRIGFIYVTSPTMSLGNWASANKVIITAYRGVRSDYSATNLPNFAGVWTGASATVSFPSLTLAGTTNTSHILWFGGQRATQTFSIPTWSRAGTIRMQSSGTNGSIVAADTNGVTANGSSIFMNTSSSQQYRTYAIEVESATPLEPTMTLAAQNTTVALGGSTALTWSSTNAASCTASGGWSGTLSASGSQTVGPITQSTTFTLACSGAQGTATSSVTVVPGITVDNVLTTDQGFQVYAFNANGTLSTIARKTDFPAGYGVVGGWSSVEIDNVGGASELLRVIFDNPATTTQVQVAWAQAAGPSAMYTLYNADGIFVASGTIPTAGTDGVDDPVTLDAGGQSYSRIDFTANLDRNFIIHSILLPDGLIVGADPVVTSIAAIGTNAAREYTVGDTDGLIQLIGTDFGTTAGAVVFSGTWGTATGTIHTTAEGSCAVGDFTDTSVCVEVPSSIPDDVYTATVTLVRADGAVATAPTLTILPRITSMTPTTVLEGDTITIAGNHLCQTGTCPTVFDAGNTITIGGVTATLVSWSHTGIVVTVPSGISAGVNTVTVTTGGTAITAGSVTFTPPPTLNLTAAATVVALGSATNLSWSTTNATSCSASGTWDDVTLFNGANWVSGQNNGRAISMNGTNQYAAAPTGVVATAGVTTISAWVNMNSLSTWMRIFDFGTGTNNYMFLAPRGGSNVIRFGIRTPAVGEQQINGTAALPTGGWHHVAVTMSGTTGVLYVDGVQVGSNTNMTLTPSSLGNTTQNWIGRSQWPDPYLNGLVQDFRIDTGAFTAAQITALMQGTASGATTIFAIGSGWSGALGTSGTQSTGAITAPTTFSLMCTGPGGSASSSVTVSPVSAATVSLTASPTSVNLNGTSTLSWSATDADSCTATGGWSGPLGASGSTSTAPLATSTVFGISCTNISGTVLASTTVTVTQPPTITGSGNGYTNTTNTAVNDGGAALDSITITGENFGAQCDTANFITIGGYQIPCANVTSWTTTSITFTIPASIDNLGGTGVNGLTITTGGQTSTPVDFVVYPSITSIAAPSTNSGAEGSVIQLIGSAFGTGAGTITFSGSWGTATATIQSTASGSCTVGGWTNTSVCVTVPGGIPDDAYVVTITLERTDGAAATAPTFTIAPQVASMSPMSGVAGDTITITGNHLCQTGTCPTSFDAGNIITIGGVTATLVSWSHTGIVVTVPPGVTIGANTVVVTTNGVSIGAGTLNVLSTTPNTPDISGVGGTGQFSNGSAVAVGEAAASSTVTFTASLSAQTSATLALEVEVKPVGTAFDASGIFVGGSVLYSGAAVLGSVTSELSNNASYHLRARVRNVSTNEVSAWVAFGSNPGGDGSGDGEPANIDLTIATGGPTVSGVGTGPGCTAHDLVKDTSARIAWTASSILSPIANKVRLATSSSMADFVEYPASNGTAPQVTLTGLVAETAYYYQVISQDSLGTETILQENEPHCTFITEEASKRINKLSEFYICQMHAQDEVWTGGSGVTCISGDDGAKTFNVFVSEMVASKPVVQTSAFVEVFGIAEASGDFTVTVNVNNIGPKTITVKNPQGSIPYRVLYHLPDGYNLDFPADTSASNLLDVQVSGADTVSSMGAKAILNYYYFPTY